MDYRELVPSPRLSPYVRCYWTLQAPANGGGSAQRVLPDGCVEIVINLGARFVRHVADGPAERQPRMLVVGPTTQHMSIAPSGAIRLVGVRFRPGGAVPFLATPPSELRNRAPALDDVALPFPPSLVERLADATPGAEAAILDQLLVTRLDRARRLPDPRLRASMRAALATSRSVRVDVLVQSTGLGARQLERRFRDTVGYGPKTFCRLARFQRVVRAVDRQPALSWARLAAMFGYADQPHMAREFREFAGTTLTGYVREQHPMSELFHSGGPDESPAT